jgi:hypothetical protein
MYPKQKTDRRAIQACDWSIEQLPGLSVQDQSKLTRTGHYNNPTTATKSQHTTITEAWLSQLQIKFST